MSESSESPLIETTHAVEQKRDATYPTEQLSSQQEWANFIDTNIPDFKGNSESAARLMMSYQKGRDYIHSKFSPKFGNFEKPDLTIVLNESQVGGSPFGSVDGASKIFVTKSFLEQYSEYDANYSHSVTRKDGEIVFSGLPDEVFQLHGVEETHHSLFHELKGPTSQKVQPTSVSLASYDSQEDEYRALRWQIQYATENHLSNEAITILNSRLEQAQKVRN